MSSIELILKADTASASAIEIITSVAEDICDHIREDNQCPLDKLV